MQMQTADVNLKAAAEEAYEYARHWLGGGRPADYIPELGRADPRRLGVAITAPEGAVYRAGDSAFRFTMQSISKVIVLAFALQDAGFEKVFSHVGMEPTGDPFNSIVRLETVQPYRPLNPMINAGAIAVTSCIKGGTAAERFRRLLEYAGQLTGNPALAYDERTYLSEKATGDRNRALAYMVRTSGALQGDVEEHLEVYFKVCSLLANCEEVSHLGAVLAGNGKSPGDGRQLIEPFHVKVIRAVMSTCGMYDESGEFALRVGVPAKSGVGGGILAAVPDRMGICVFSPALDQKGNSLCGIKALEYLSQTLCLSIF